MERYLKPDRLDHDTSDSDSTDKWRYWRKMFGGFLIVLQLSSNTTLISIKKYTLPLYHVSTLIYRNLSECENYETAVEILEAMFVTKMNTIFARLATKRQLLEKNLEQSQVPI